MGLFDRNRKAVRGPVNPLDKCTVISIYNREITEIKPTVQPGKFVIPAGSYEKPSVLVVGSSSWWREVDEQQPLLEIPHSSIQVATSIVNDYCNGLLACDMNNARPGIFFVMGEFHREEIRSKHRQLLEVANTKQLNWYKALVKMADSLWARTNGNPLSINEDMRTAAKELNLNGKDWMADFQMMETIKCIACGSPRNPKFPVCPSCHNIVDRPLYDRLGIKSGDAVDFTPSIVASEIPGIKTTEAIEKDLLKQSAIQEATKVNPFGSIDETRF